MELSRRLSLLQDSVKTTRTKQARLGKRNRIHFWPIRFDISNRHPCQSSVSRNLEIGYLMEWKLPRVGETVEGSHQRQWRHVPGVLNPADEWSRGMKAEDLSESHRWFCGPSFLRDNNTSWPTQLPLPTTERWGSRNINKKRGVATHR